MSDDSTLKGLILLGVGAGAVYIVATKTDWLGNNNNKLKENSYKILEVVKDAASDETTTIESDATATLSSDSRSVTVGDQSFYLGEDYISDSADANGVGWLNTVMKFINPLYLPISSTLNEAIKKNERDRLVSAITGYQDPNIILPSEDQNITEQKLPTYGGH